LGPCKSYSLAADEALWSKHISPEVRALVEHNKNSIADMSMWRKYGKRNRGIGGDSLVSKAPNFRKPFKHWCDS
jgi:hypothetical protein